MNLTLADQSTLTSIGAQESPEYIDGQRRLGVKYIFDATKYQDEHLRNIFTNRDKTKTMRIDKGTPLDGYTIFVRSVYEADQISVVMAQDMPAAEARLKEQVAQQAKAIATVFGATPTDLANEAPAIRAGIEAMAAYAPDEIGAQHPNLFPAWDAAGHEYAIGDRVQYDGLLYKCLTNHPSQDDWQPEKAPSLWVRIDDPAIEWPEWRQPLGSTDAYAKGIKVSHNGKRWTSDVDSNVWEPPTQWTEVII